MKDFIDGHLDKCLAFLAMVLFASATVFVAKYYPTNADLLRDMHDGLLSMTSIFGVLVYPGGMNLLRKLGPAQQDSSQKQPTTE